MEAGHKPRRYEPVRKLSSALGVHPQQVDEFQGLVGKTALPTSEEERKAVLAAIELGKKEGYIDSAQFWAEVRNL